MEKNQKPRTTELPPPKCKAMLVCERTTKDDRTGKTSVHGIFNSVTMVQFPGRTFPFNVFIQLTNGFGRYELRLDVHDLKDDKLLFSAHGIKIDFPDRMHRFNLTIPMPPFTLPHPGAYDLVLFANGDEIERQKLSATTPEALSNYFHQHSTDDV